MTFANLNYLWLILLVPALVAFYAWAFRAKRRALERFADAEVVDQLVVDVSLLRQRWKAALVVLAVLFGVLALMQPQWGGKWEEVHRVGVDIIVAVDVSRSMLASDEKPTRLDAAKREIEDLLRVLQGDRIGLVAFAGKAIVQCPLTLDYGAFRMFLDDLGPSSVPIGGTAIGDAIRKCIDAFESKVKKHKVIILITDGEDHGSDPIGAAKQAEKQGIVIFAIGMGTPEGAYILIKGEHGQRIRLKSRDGQVVKSRLDEETLGKIALITGGKYRRAISKDWPLERIYKEKIATMEKKKLGTHRYFRRENRFQVPLAIMVVLLFLECFISDRKRT